MKSDLLIDYICSIHLFISFFGIFVGLGLAMLSVMYFDYHVEQNPFLLITMYCGISGIILAFTDKYWDLSVKDRAQQKQDSVK